MFLLSLAARNLFRNLRRTLLSIVAVIAGVAVLIIGYAFIGGTNENIIRAAEGKHRLWTEVGYDLTVDVYDYDLLDTMGADPATLLADQVIHSARVFLGYDNSVAENLTFRTGAEFLLNLDFDVFRTDPDGTQYNGYEDIRLNWENALRINIVGSLLAELKFNMLFDNVPTFGASDGSGSSSESTGL